MEFGIWLIWAQTPVICQYCIWKIWFIFIFALCYRHERVFVCVSVCLYAAFVDLIKMVWHLPYFFCLGDTYVYGHVSRALYFRLVRDEDAPLQLPSTFHATCPEFFHTKIGTCGQETEKSTAVAVVWHTGIAKAEVLDGTAGKFVEEYASMFPASIANHFILSRRWDSSGIFSVWSGDVSNIWWIVGIRCNCVIGLYWKSLNS